MNELNNCVFLYLTSYNFWGTDENLEKEFFTVVQEWVDRVKETSSEFISLQLYRSGISSNYILFEVWQCNSDEERFCYHEELNESVKQCVNSTVKIIPWSIAQNIILNQPVGSTGISYYPYNALECSVLTLDGINNIDYIPAESFWNRGLEEYTDAAQSKQIWINNQNPWEVSITILWRTYVSWKRFPLPLISMLDSKTRDFISPATYIYDAYDCFLIENKESSDYY